jgi:hypothetical protein
MARNSSKWDVERKALRLWVPGRIYGDNKEGILLHGGGDNRVLAITKNDGMVTFHEQCDGYFYVMMSRADARAALLEALAWIDQ